MLSDQQWAEYLADQEAESRRRVEREGLEAIVKAWDYAGPRAAGMGQRRCDLCGKKVTPACPRDERWDQPPEGYGPAFRNLLCLHEWQINGACQACQDELDRASIPADDLPVWGVA